MYLGHERPDRLPHPGALPLPRSRPLIESERLQIVFMHLKGEMNSTIAQQLNRNESTIRSFVKAWDSRKTIVPAKPGRPKIEITLQQRVEMLEALTRVPRATVREHAETFHLGKNIVDRFRHANGYHFYKDTDVCDLTCEHKRERVRFCEQELSRPCQIPIVFTDESTVQMNLKKGGIWRKRGVHLEQEYSPTTAHPIQVMVWGGILTDGTVTPLIKCPPSVTGEAYIEFLCHNSIIGFLNARLGVKNYIFQQDNAPAHSKYQDLLLQYVKMFDWPAKSPDLSPIEQIWAYMKNRLKGRRFGTEDQLYNALVEEWTNLSPDMVRNFTSSFHARCKVCYDIKGESLNGHWAQVHKEHHQDHPTEGGT
jgi:transposase